MKQLKSLVLGFVALLCCVTTQAQDVKHRTFVYGGANYTPHNTLSYGVEAGIWGISSNTSFSATLDFVPTLVGNKTTQWVGVKAYWTVHDEKKLSYMVYLAPKTTVDNSNQQCLEYGFNPNYKLNNDLLLSVTLGQQYYFNSTTATFGSAGLIVLLNKFN